MTDKKNDYKFSGKYIIKADLRCVTGLHIGGTDEGFEIGGIDNPVIKDTITGYPYIPDSSLKGKMRSLLEWTTSYKDKIRENNTEKEIERTRVENMLKQKDGKWNAKACNCSECDVCIIFGTSADTKGQKEPTRLTVRDSFPQKTTIENWNANLGENIYTEVKTENTIDRLTSEANPRSMERIPADSVFEVEMLFDIYKDDDKQKLKKVFEGMILLEDSALGGGGSRGSGKVVFENIKVTHRSLDYYIKGNNGIPISIDGNSKSARDIYKDFDKLFNREAKNEYLSDKT